MSEQEILNLIFINGYSTSSVVTEVSGRGIGLDIVRRDIESLKGEVVLETKKDQGIKFSLILPLTIAVAKALLVKTGNMSFAFPMTFVSECVDVAAQDISTLEGKMCIQVREHSVPVVRLNDVLGLASHNTEEEKEMAVNTIPVVIAQHFEKKVGFLVDEIVSEADIFVKSLGPHLGKVKNVSGATILGTGEVVVILDVADLISSSASSHKPEGYGLASYSQSHPAVSGERIMSGKSRAPKRILVVEDALTTREFEKSILESQGYLVDTAVDGLDALSKLQEFKYDIIVTDIQMPRMDGFELCRKIKQSEAYKDIPVAMVTALEKEEDKRRGMEAGASAYIVKSAFDQKSLIDTVERLIG